MLAFDTETAAQKIIKNRLFIAGISVRTVKYEEKNTNIQCQKCQKFDHTTHSCKNLAVCQFYTQNHFTRLHTCKVCETVKEICIHTVIKCSNCAGSHTANRCANLTDIQQSATSTEASSDSQLKQMLNQVFTEMKE